MIILPIHLELREELEIIEHVASVGHNHIHALLVRRELLCLGQSSHSSTPQTTRANIVLSVIISEVLVHLVVAIKIQERHGEEILLPDVL